MRRNERYTLSLVHDFFLLRTVAPIRSGRRLPKGLLRPNSEFIDSREHRVQILVAPKLHEFETLCPRIHREWEYCGPGTDRRACALAPAERPSQSTPYV